MRAERLERLSLYLQYLVAGGAVLYIALYVILALVRLRYPFELEWMEGGAVDHVRRILSGQPLYVRPSLDFVPFIYTPLYFYLSAALAWVIGVGFLPLRLVSLLSSLGCFLLLFLLVRREAGRVLPGIVAAGLYAALFRLGGAWFDVARVDSLFLLLLLAAVYLVRFGRSSWGQLSAGLLFALAFLTKQTALFIFVPLALYALLAYRRRALFFVGTAALLIGGSTLLLNRLYHGWYLYYVFELPGQHPLLLNQLLRFWLVDLFRPLPLVCLVVAWYLWQRVRQEKQGERWFYPLLAAGMLAASWFSRLHVGGYDNVLLPALVVLAILFGLGLSSFVESAQGGERRVVLNLVVIALALVQIAGLLYDPAAQVPTARDVEAGQEFVQSLKEIPGDVLVPYHGYLPTLAGKKSYAHWYAVSDVLRGAEGPIRDELLQEFRAAIRSQRFAALVLDLPEWFQEDVQQVYQPAGRVLNDDAAFWPVTGPRIRPELLYVPLVDAAP